LLISSAEIIHLSKGIWNIRNWKRASSGFVLHVATRGEDTRWRLFLTSLIVCIGGDIAAALLGRLPESISKSNSLPGTSVSAAAVVLLGHADAVSRSERVKGRLKV